MEKKRNIVEWAMHYRQIVILVTCCLVAFGIYSLPQMQKNEFPDFTIRQGMVIAVAPGNTVNEMVEQASKRVVACGKFTATGVKTTSFHTRK